MNLCAVHLFVVCAVGVHDCLNNKSGHAVATQVTLMNVVGGLLKACGCQGQRFSTWVEETFVNSVANSQGEARYSMADAISAFCSIFKSLPGNFEASVAKILGDETKQLFELLQGIVKDSLPSLFDKLAEQFSSACLASQSWFPQGIAFLPSPDSRDQDFWMRASTYDIPGGKLSVLNDVYSAIKSASATAYGETTVNTCTQDFYKAALMQNSSFIVYVVMRESLLASPGLERLAAIMPSVQKPITEIIQALKHLESHQNIGSFKDYIVQHIVEPAHWACVDSFGRIHCTGWVLVRFNFDRCLMFDIDFHLPDVGLGLFLYIPAWL